MQPGFEIGGFPLSSAAAEGCRPLVGGTGVGGSSVDAECSHWRIWGIYRQAGPLTKLAELLADLQLLFGSEGGTRALLPIAQGGVKDAHLHQCAHSLGTPYNTTQSPATLLGPLRDSDSIA